jgi:3-dehydroquinate synthetase
MIIPGSAWQHFINANPDALLPFLSNDKKAEGSNLKLATLQSLGDMKFIDLPLDATGIAEVKQAIEQIIHG